MKRLVGNLVFVPPIAVIVLLLLDILFMSSHPIAALFGTMLAHMLDPIVVVPSLMVGALAKPDWRPVLGAFAIGAIAEMLNMNNILRQMEGTAGFQGFSWFARSMASCTIMAIFAAGKLWLGRPMKKRAAHDHNSRGG